MRRPKSIWLATLSTSGASGAASIGPKPTMMFCKNSCAKCAKAASSYSSRAITTRPCANIAARISVGPKDVLTDPACGALGSDLQAMAIQALDLDRKAARAHALRYSWENSAQEFIGNVLEAHNLGLPKKRTRFRRWRGRRMPQKESGPVGGNRAASILMRQFGGRDGGRCVHPEMVGGSLLFKRWNVIFAPIVS